MQIDWEGVLFIGATQFRRDESLDLEATQRHLESLIAAGCGGIVMLGRFGETMALTRAERRKVILAAKEVIDRRVPLLSGCIETSPQDAFAYAREMERLGIDGLMATPLLGYPPKKEEAAHYFRRLAQASQLPIMIYNEPGGYGVDITPDVLLELAAEPTIVAIKESTEKTNRITDILRECGDRFRLFCGADQIILESMLMGCDGWVCALGNALPVESVKLVGLAQQGRFLEARPIARWMQPLLNFDARPTFVQCGKLAMQIAGHGSEMVRTPLLPLSGAEREEVIRVTETVLETRPAI